MKATGALPTEDRIQRMNDQQWLWYYFNLVKDQEEEEKRWKARLDYMGWWANPQLARSVMEQESAMKQSETSKFKEENVLQENQVISDTFEDELKKALSEAGLKEDEFVQLPDSHNVGNAFESKDDFLERVMKQAENLGVNNNIPIGIMPEGIEEPPMSLEEMLQKSGAKINPEDIDYFDYPEE